MKDLDVTGAPYETLSDEGRRVVDDISVALEGVLDATARLQVIDGVLATEIKNMVATAPNHAVVTTMAIFVSAVLDRLDPWPITSEEHAILHCCASVDERRKAGQTWLRFNAGVTTFSAAVLEEQNLPGIKKHARRKPVNPTLLCEKKDGARFVLKVDYPGNTLISRQITALMFGRTMREKGVVRFCHFSESWMSVNGDETLRPSQDPNHIDALHLQAHDTDGEWSVRIFRIDRSNPKRPRLEPMGEDTRGKRPGNPPFLKVSFSASVSD